MVAPGVWEDEAPRPGYLTGQVIAGGPIVTRGKMESPTRTAEGQREYRRRQRALARASRDAA